MGQILPIILIGALIVVLFDTIASLISRSFQIQYTLFAVGSYLIYASVGFVAAKYSDLLSALVAVLLVALVDVTLGWYISWVIGPGRLEGGLTPQTILVSVAFVLTTAFIAGFIGAFISRWF